MDDAPKFRFVVECAPDPDVLVRLLDRFHSQQALVEEVEHALAGTQARTVIRASRLARDQAERLVRSLQALPFVRSVGFGW